MMAIDTQLGCQLTHLWIGMLHEVLLGNKVLVSRMLYRLLQNTVIALIAKREVIAT